MLIYAFDFLAPPATEHDMREIILGVSYCATCNGSFYQGSETCIVGKSAEVIEHWIGKVDVEDDNMHTKELLVHDNVKYWSKIHLININ